MDTYLSSEGQLVTNETARDYAADTGKSFTEAKAELIQEAKDYAEFMKRYRAEEADNEDLMMLGQTLS